MDENDYIRELNINIKCLNRSIKKMRLGDYIESLNKPSKIFYYNFVWGLTRGFGMAVGFTLITGILIYFLGFLVQLNLPIIGGFIADIVEIVKNNLDGR